MLDQHIGAAELAGLRAYVLALLTRIHSEQDQLTHVRIDAEIVEGQIEIDVEFWNEGSDVPTGGFSL